MMCEFIVIALLLLLLVYIQKTNQECPKIFGSPDNLRYYSCPHRFRNNYANNSYNMGFQESQMSDNDSNGDHINDRINENYRQNPFLPFPKKEGMGDVVRGLWGTTRTQPGMSNDGRTTEENHKLTEMMTPGFRNEIADKVHKLSVTASRVSNLPRTTMEGNTSAHPWSR